MHGRSLADQAFSRATGAPLVPGNRIRLLRDAEENYPAWLEAIEGAESWVHFENYIIRDDASGQRFAQAFRQKAHEGVTVRVLYDWMGAVGKTSPWYWADLRDAGVEVRCYNPLRPSNPLDWMRRNHRKSLVVDGAVGFVTGLCVGDEWAGNPARDVAPWRDTGLEVRGPAVAEIERAFRSMWGLAGPSLPDDTCPIPNQPIAGDVSVRIVASEPVRGGLLRADQLVAAAAQDSLWLTDAYFVGIPSYVHALRSAALDGVDVRLLVPGGTDLPYLRWLSQAGYRPLLEAGVRVFEWNGPMLHAKTAVADSGWARVGSSNLNLASWIGNYELDAIVEDAAFARTMETQYLRDLENATEILLARPRSPRPHPTRGRRGTGSAGRVAAGAMRIGNTMTAVVSNPRVLAPAEGRIVALVAAVFAVAAPAAFFWPRLVAWPLATILAWLAIVLFVRAYHLYRAGHSPLD